MTFPRLNPICLLALAVAAFASCSTDDFDDDLSPQTPSSTSSGETITVNINLSVADSNASTRAADTTAVVGSDAENMYSWYVIAVENNGNTVAATASGSSTSALTDKEITMDLTEGGSYTFYSFANISASQVLSALGLSTLSTSTSLTESAMSSATFTVAGNGFDTSASHIPMSGKDVYESISGDVDLYVYRMLAKVELQLTNGSGNTVTLNSVTISDVTSNVDKNIYLLPDNYVTTGGVKYCEPNLSTSTTDDYTYTLSSPQTISADSSDPTTVTFYINESEVPGTSLTQYFILTLNVTTNGSVTDERYALLEWNAIARNDYRIIPITIDDYKLDITPKDFSAIGVYPASVKEEDGIFTITFHAPGHFHLVPTVTKVSTGEEIEYVSSLDGTTDTWTISSWTKISATDGLFETSTDEYCTGDNGGEPVWDSLNEFYFGKFAEDVTGTACYTLSASVLTSNSVSREYTYTVYLIRE